MPCCHPTRRILGIPAWFCVALPIALLVLGNLLWKIWPPSKLAEPSTRAEIFREPIFLTRDGTSFRFVPFNDSKNVKPLWAVTVVIQEKSNATWNNPYFLPGLFHRESKWNYELTTTPFGSEWKPNSENPATLPAEEMRRLRPLLVAELNRSGASPPLGDRLESMLKDGLEDKSIFCPQNALILVCWLSIPLAVAGLYSMFAGTSPPSADNTTNPSPN